MAKPRRPIGQTAQQGFVWGRLAGQSELLQRAIELALLAGQPQRAAQASLAGGVAQSWHLKNLQHQPTLLSFYGEQQAPQNTGKHLDRSGCRHA
jgi:hypothetical protein